MNYQVITDFRGGLDARKYKLSLPPGTLTKLNNGHITPGGEIEKRLAFIPYTLPSGTGYTFGACAVSAGIMVFGSATAATVGALPAGFYYTQLVHPDGTTVMTGAVSSVLNGDYAFVAATFADGHVYHYYNGVLVPDFTAGLITSYLNTNAKISAALTALVNATGSYTAIQDANPNDNEFDVFSQPGNSYAAQVTIASECGLTITSTDDTNYQGATITSTDGTNAVNGKTFSIGGKPYTFRTALTTEGEVLIGTTVGASMTNLYNAINHTGTPNTDYKCAAANTNVYAQNLNTANVPQFQVVARVANTQSEVINTILGVNYETDAPTVNRAIPIQASGQFKISALNPVSNTYASATIRTNGTNPGTGSSLTINATTYTFTTAGGTLTVANQIKIGANVAATFDNLIACINHAAGSGTAYGNLSAINPDVTASARVGTGSSSTFIITAKTSGAGGNYALGNADGRVLGPSAMSGGAASGISGIMVGKIFASGTLTTNGTNPSNHDTVTIDTVTYRFCTSLTDGLTNDVLIGANAATTMQNLIQAINGSGIQNFDYIITNPHPTVTALPSLTSGILQVNARLAGAAGNSIALAVSGATITRSGATLAGGADTVQLLNGTVYSVNGQTLNDFTLAVVAAINANTVLSGYTATAVANTVYIKAVASNSFSNQADITVTVPSQNLVAVGFCAFEFSYGLAASGAINTNAGITLKVNAVQVNGANITTIAITGTSISDLATRIQDNIKANAGANTVYTAVAQGSRLYIAKLVTSSADAPLVVTLQSGNPDTLGISQVGQDGLVAVATPDYIGFIRRAIGGTFQRGSLLNPFGVGTTTGILETVFTGPVGAIAGALGFGKSAKMFTESFSPIVAACQPTGGYPPYKFLWQKVSGADGFSVSDPNAAIVTFARPDNAGTSSAGWRCTVTDSLGNTVDSNKIKVYQP